MMWIAIVPFFMNRGTFVHAMCHAHIKLQWSRFRCKGCGPKAMVSLVDLVVIPTLRLIANRKVVIEAKKVMEFFY